MFLEALLGTKSLGGSADTFTPADLLSWWTIEKQIGSATPTELIVQYSDSMVNTLSISAPSGALATFSAGIIAAFEARTDRTNAGNNPIIDTTAAAAYPAAYDDLLVFHGGRIYMADSPTGQPNPQNPVKDETWQSAEIALNNNIDATEYTVRPSRFLRSLTQGIRQVDINFTMVFDTPDKYSKYAYGQQVNNSPGYNLYMGAIQLFLGNYQLLNPDLDGVGSIFPYAGASNLKKFTPATPGTNVYLPGGNGPGISTPLSPGNGGQFVQLNVPKAAFTGFPVALTSGRIVVTSSARALKDPNAPIVTAYVGPGGAGLQY